MVDQTVLLVGAGKEQRRIFELATDMGLRIIASDLNPSAPCFSSADHRLVLSSRNPVAIARACEQAGLVPDGVTTLGNDVPLTLAYLADHFGLAGLSQKSANLLADKQLMKGAFRVSGVPTPHHRVLEADDSHPRFDNFPDGSLIVKPVNGRGARGVARAASQSELEHAVEIARAESGGGTVLIESFVEGPQYSVEGFVIEGRTRLCGISERNYTKNPRFYPHVVEDGGTISESDPPEFFAEAEELLGASAAAMEISNGPVKGDFVRSESGQLMVIEIAGRLSGGWFASDQILAARGIDLVEIALKFALGIEIFPSDLDAKRQHATAIRYWFPQPGQLQRIEGLEEIKTRSDIIQSDTFFQPGEEIPLTTKHSDRAGFVISRGNSKSQAIQAAESAINQVSFVTT